MIKDAKAGVMFGIGWFEMLVIGVVALVTVGPDKLPEMARAVGKLYAKIWRAAEEAKAAVTAEVNLDESLSKHSDKNSSDDKANDA